MIITTNPLPIAAQEMLRVAATESKPQDRAAKIDEAIEAVKKKYPSFFKKEIA